MTTINHHEYTVYEDSVGGLHPIRFISNEHGALVRIGDEAIVIIVPTKEGEPWCIAEVDGMAHYFDTPEAVEAWTDAWTARRFDALTQ